MIFLMHLHMLNNSRYVEAIAFYARECNTYLRAHHIFMSTKPCLFPLSYIFGKVKIHDVEHSMKYVSDLKLGSILYIKTNKFYEGKSYQII